MGNRFAQGEILSSVCSKTRKMHYGCINNAQYSSVATSVTDLLVITLPWAFNPNTYLTLWCVYAL